MCKLFSSAKLHYVLSEQKRATQNKDLTLVYPVHRVFVVKLTLVELADLLRSAKKTSNVSAS